MTENKIARRTRRRGVLAVAVLFAMAGVGAAAWLAGSVGSNWKELYAWYNPAAGFQSATLPVGFEDLVDRIKPTVVGVRAKVERDAEDDGASDRGAPSNRSDLPGGGAATPQHRTAMSLGSGFFISSDGYAITTNHVVERSEKIEVTTDDGSVYAARMVGADPKTDLALLKIDGGNKFPAAQIADKAPRIGEWVLAVGNPFGLGGTVTAGIVSARARDILGPYNDFIQIDAPVNQGNSGGPAFDVSGKVIGVNSAIFSPTGGSIGIGFAIPGQTVKTIADKLKEKGSVSRGWIGVEVQSVSPEIVEGLGLNKPMFGVLVAEVQPDSPATKAGILPGDVITSLAGQPASDDREFIKRVGEMPPGKSVELGLIHHGEKATVNVTLGELPVASNQSRSSTEAKKTPSEKSDQPNIGLTLMAADKVGLGIRGVVVVDLDPTGKAAESGLSAGDVIFDVGGNNVETPVDFYKALTGIQSMGRRIALARVKSSKATRFIAIPIG